MEILSVVIVAAIALFFWWLSSTRAKRIQAYTDEFARAFVDLADYLGVKPDLHAALHTERTVDGGNRVLPREDQPENIRAMMDLGADDTVMRCLEKLYRQREEAQAHLTTINLIGDKYNTVLNSCYDDANVFCLAISKPGALLNDKQLESVNIFLQKQRLLRNKTLPAIVSDDCAREIAAV